MALVVKNLPANAVDVRDAGSIPRSERSPGGGNGNSLQYSCLENPKDRGAWQAELPRATESWTQLKQLSSSAYCNFKKWNYLSQLNMNYLKPCVGRLMRYVWHLKILCKPNNLFPTFYKTADWIKQRYFLLQRTIRFFQLVEFNLPWEFKGHNTVFLRRLKGRYLQPDSHLTIIIHLALHFSTMLMNGALITVFLSQSCLLPVMPISSILEGLAAVSSPVSRPSENTDLH